MKAPIQRILFATDLSAKAGRAFPFVAGLAAHHCAGLVILHVMQEPPKKETYLNMVNNLIGEERWRELREADAQKARHILIGKKTEAHEIRSSVGDFCMLMQAQHPDVKIYEDDVMAVQGPVAETIVKTAQATGCDMIVMGYHRRGGLTDVMAGNIVKTVLRKARVPVLLLPPPEEMDQ
jgi:nucleotide-binding universal stress UspA family protein